jgi:hypothetical protein
VGETFTEIGVVTLEPDYNVTITGDSDNTEKVILLYSEEGEDGACITLGVGALYVKNITIKFDGFFKGCFCIINGLFDNYFISFHFILFYFVLFNLIYFFIIFSSFLIYFVMFYFILFYLN